MDTRYLIDMRLKADKAEGRSDYPYSLPAVRHLGRLEFSPTVTFLVGRTVRASPPSWRRWP